ncbi:MAG: glycosyltransferase family 1 protein [Aequorivita sp.]|nr:glycosyltransferase family 1 protein [Aequorivita sp.]MBP42531.1 glycosyltransferase family 1 protein [Aequorivita sp.]HBC02688.1 glycosyltransferase family 1 protein [Aequorivita sp.]
MKKLVRITTVPISLEKLLEGQLGFMKAYFEVVAISAVKEKLEAYGKKEGVRVFPLELTRKITPIKDIAAVFKLYRFLKKEKPSIVHTHTPKAGIVGMTAAWFAGVPNRLHTVAGMPLMEASGFKRKVLNFVEKLTYRFATEVYPNSKGLYDFIIAENFTKASKLSIIGNGSSNGIDTKYFDPVSYSENDKISLRDKLKIPQGHFLYIFVGRLVKDKGINELITAFSKLSDSNNAISLLLVGPFENDLDPLLPESLSTIEKHPNIYTVGYQSDVRPYFSIADALVFPSYREGFPNVVMQAGAMGLPSIVTDINGCNEIIAHGKNGLIIPSKDTQALYNSIKQLSTKPSLFANLKANSREMITSRYERQQVWDALLFKYQRLLGKDK